MNTTGLCSLVVALGTLGLTAACGAPSPEPDDPQPIDVAPVTTAPDPQATTDEPIAEPVPDPEPVDSDAEGDTCTGLGDCPDGQMCSGPEGCDVEWRCVPSGPCTRDLVTYCGCDGQEIQGSGSCPPAPYAHRGAC